MVMVELLLVTDREKVTLYKCHYDTEEQLHRTITWVPMNLLFYTWSLTRSLLKMNIILY